MKQAHFVLILSPGKAKSFKLESVHAEFLERGCYVFNPDVVDKRRVATVRILRIVLKALSQKSMPEPVADSQRAVVAWEARQPDRAGHP